MDSQELFQLALDTAKSRIAALERENAELRAASQQGHPSPCTLGPLCPYCEIDRLRAALASAHRWIRNAPPRRDGACSECFPEEVQPEHLRGFVCGWHQAARSSSAAGEPESAGK